MHHCVFKGRGGYGYIIFDLTSSQVVNRGCMTLPYGMTAGKAEFEGLNAGLQAAVDAGIRRLAVQVRLCGTMRSYHALSAPNMVSAFREGCYTWTPHCLIAHHVEHPDSGVVQILTVREMLAARGLSGV